MKQLNLRSPKKKISDDLPSTNGLQNYVDSGIDLSSAVQSPTRGSTNASRLSKLLRNSQWVANSILNSPTSTKQGHFGPEEEISCNFFDKTTKSSKPRSRSRRPRSSHPLSMRDKKQLNWIRIFDDKNPLLKKKSIRRKLWKMSTTK